jgi:hypothetical protein
MAIQILNLNTVAEPWRSDYSTEGAGGKRPNREQIEQFFGAYLDAAEAWPHGDGLSVAWHEVMKHLRPSDFTR